MRELLVPIPTPPRGKQANQVQTYTKLKDAEKQLEDIRKSVKRKKADHTIQMEQVRLNNAEAVVNTIRRNLRRKENQDVMRQLEFEEQEKDDALEQAQEELAQAQAEGVPEQKGEGKRVPSRKLKQKGGKTAKIDNEHKQRLRALLM